MKYKLGDIATIKMGQSPAGKDLNTDGEGVPFLQGRKTFGRIYPTIDTWTTAPKKIGKNGSILLSLRAPVGDINIANQDICIGRGLCSIESKDNFLQKYIYYLLLFNKQIIQSKATGTTFQGINRDDLHNLEIDVPDLETQNKIARILSALDKRIELNNQQNATLEQIINVHYYSVFSASNNQKRVKASDLFDYEGGYSYTSAELADESSIGMMTIKNFDRNGGFKTDGFKALHPNKDKYKTAELFDIFISCTDVTQNADIIGNAIMLLDTDKYKTITYSMDLVRIVPKINRFALFALLASKEFKNFALGYKSGTTVLHLNKKCLIEYEVALPDEEILDSFGEMVEKVYKKVAINLAENRNLTQMRDSLLPKLMSGEINLDKVEI